LLEPEVANMDALSSDQKEKKPDKTVPTRKHGSLHPTRLFSEKTIKLLRLRLGLNPTKKIYTHQEAFAEIYPTAGSLAESEKNKMSLYLSQDLSKAKKDLQRILQNEVDLTHLEPDNVQFIKDFTDSFRGKTFEQIEATLKGKVISPTSGSGVAGKDPFH
jgi:hypothetical protein